MRRTFTADGKPIDLGDKLLPDEEVTKRTREYMLNTGEKDFAVAKRVVLQADIELANRYTKEQFS